MATLFIVASRHAANDETIKSLIVQHFPTDYYDIGRGQWIVAFSGTAKELFETLIPDGQEDAILPTSGGTVVFGISGYWGFTTEDLWEWMTVKRRKRAE
jgi:hypothetical protein